MILTSYEHMFWNTPRRVTVVERMRAAPPLVECVLLEVAASEPDGPLWLVASSRYGDAWQPRAGTDFPVMIWQLAERPRLSAADCDQYRAPSSRAQAWCTIRVDDEEGG